MQIYRKIHRFIFTGVGLVFFIAFTLQIDAQKVSATTGVYQLFQNGVIHSSDLGTFATSGNLAKRYMADGGSGFYGFPLGEEYIDTQRGKCQLFEFGTLCESSGTYCDEYRRGNLTMPFYETRCGTLLQSGVIKLPNVGVVSRKDWGAKYSQEGSNLATYSYFVRDREKPLNQTVHTIVIHHTTDPQNQSIRELEEKAKSLGYDSIPYHFVIDGKGVIYEGRPLEFLGDHVKEQNYGRIGVAVMGDFEPRIQNFWRADVVTGEQLSSLKLLIDDLQDEYTVDVSAIMGHKDVVGQTGECPGMNLLNYLEEIRDYANKN